MSRSSVSLSQDSALVDAARALGLDLSSIAEGAIGREVALAAVERFRAEVALGVAEHEAYLAEYGSLSEAVRAMVEVE